MVRPHLEYGCVVWSPYGITSSIKLETVQHHFLRFLSFVMGRPMHFTDHDYDSLMLLLQIPTLASRRAMFDLLFIYKLINEKIECQQLRSLIALRVPTRPTRLYEPFAIARKRTDVGQNDTFVRALILANGLSQSGNAFGDSETVFKRKVASYLTELGL